MQDIVIYILDSAPEAVQALCAEVHTALSMELDRYRAPLLLLKEGDSPARDALRLGKWAFLQCCKIVRNAAEWRQVVAPLALQVCSLLSHCAAICQRVCLGAGACTRSRVALAAACTLRPSPSPSPCASSSSSASASACAPGACSPRTRACNLASSSLRAGRLH